ncbi:MAG: hypothetical protein L0207_05215 [Chlamydiae bacterium]|nr:hypothetical protein [Chlamydiota bacterium]
MEAKKEYDGERYLEVGVQLLLFAILGSKVNKQANLRSQKAPSKNIAETGGLKRVDCNGTINPPLKQFTSTDLEQVYEKIKGAKGPFDFAA